MKIHSSPSISTLVRSALITVGGIVVLILVGLALASSTGSISMSSATRPLQPAQDTPVRGPQARVVHSHNYGVWSYTAVQDDGDGLVHPTVQFDQRSEQGLRAYAAANKVLAGELAGHGGQVDVIMTFNQLLQPDQFRSWARTNGLVVKLTSLRTVEANGTKGSIGIKATPGDPLPNSADPHDLIQGVYNVSARVAAGRLRQLAEDPFVFLLDVTPTVVRQDLVTANIPEARQATVQFLSSPFWNMEELGLVNEPTPSLPPPVGTAQPEVSTPIP